MEYKSTELFFDSLHINYLSLILLKHIRTIIKDTIHFEWIFENQQASRADQILFW